MPHSYFSSLTAKCFLAAGLAATTLPASAAQKSESSSLPPATKQANSPKAAAYYHYSLGHLYAEMAASYGNRGDYINKAIENFRLAMKEDPEADFLVEDIAELYLASGRVKDAVEEAQNALKANPNQINAHRVLAHIYRGQIGGDGQSNPNEGMVKRALEQYQIIADKDPKDMEALIMVGSLDQLLENSVDAEAAFKKALAIEPDNEDALVGLAGLYGRRGDTAAANELLQRLATKDPSGRAYEMLGQNYEGAKKYDLAAEAFQKAFELEPGQLEFLASAARDQAIAGNFDAAIKSYQQIADAKPLDAEPYMRMAQIREDQRNLEDARHYMDKAKEIDKFSVDVEHADASLLADEGKLPEAITEMKSVLEAVAKPNSDPRVRVQLLDELGSLYRRNTQYDQAVDCYKQMIAADSSLAAKGAAAIIDTHREAHDYSKAQQEADVAVASFPDSPDIRSARAQLFSDQGKTDAAVAELRKLTTNKNELGIDIETAELYERGHNYAEAAKALDAAEKLAKDDKERTSIFFSRGALYERQKKFDLAEKEFRRVLDADAKNASALNYLGYMLADQNVRLPEAQDYIKRAVDLEPGNYAFLDSLGWVYFRLNKLDEAEQQLSRSLQLSAEKDPTIHDHMGDVYFKQGKLKLAISQWQSSLKAYNSGAPGDMEPDEIAKVQKKLDSARVKLAKEQAPAKRN